MILPAQLSTYWSDWTSFCPIGDFAFGTLSPELGDMDLNWSPPVPQLPDIDVTSIPCNLNPALFKDDIPKESEGRATWTKTQRSKAASCDVLHTVDDLSTWVSF